MVDPLELLDRIRQAKARRPSPTPAQVIGKDPAHVVLEISVERILGNV